MGATNERSQQRMQLWQQSTKKCWRSLSCRSLICWDLKWGELSPVPCLSVTSASFHTFFKAISFSFGCLLLVQAFLNLQQFLHEFRAVCDVSFHSSLVKYLKSCSVSGELLEGIPEIRAMQILPFPVPGLFLCTPGWFYCFYFCFWIILQSFNS